MNHLVVSQNSNLEILGNSSNTIGVRIIEKLYELAHAGLDSSSSLSGNLQVSKAYRDSVGWLNQNTDLNIVVTDDHYIRFADPEVARILNSTFGDGIGVTESAAANVTNGGWGPYFDYFYENADIVTFDEMKYFTSITTLHQRGPYYSPQGCFKNCTSLETIDMRNITVVAEGNFWGCTSLRELKNFHPTALNVDWRGDYTFCECASLEEIDLSRVQVIPGCCFTECTSLSNINNMENVRLIGARAFEYCNNLNIDLYLPNLGNEIGAEHYSGEIPYRTFRYTKIKSIQNLGKCTTIGGSDGYAGDWNPGAFAYCTSLRYAILPDTLTYIRGNAFRGDTALEWIKCLATTPPTLEVTDPTDYHYPFYETTCNFYVPDASVNDYKAAAGWSSMASRIFPMSQFSTDFPND